MNWRTGIALALGVIVVILLFRYFSQPQSGVSTTPIPTYSDRPSYDQLVAENQELRAQAEKYRILAVIYEDILLTWGIPRPTQDELRVRGYNRDRFWRENWCTWLNQVLPRIRENFQNAFCTPTCCGSTCQPPRTTTRTTTRRTTPTPPPVTTAPPPVVTDTVINSGDNIYLPPAPPTAPPRNRSGGTEVYTVPLGPR